MAGDRSPAIRRAGPGDAGEISRVLTGSIRELCVADHRNDPDALADWLDNKTEESVRGWLQEAHNVWLRTEAGAIAAVGACSDAGEVRLLYVAPGYQRRGHCAALLRHMEREMARAGLAEAYLTSTGTAQRFYRAQGWQDAGALVDCHRTEGWPMRKVLGTGGDSVS